MKPLDEMPDTLLTTEQACQFLPFTKNTMQQHRSQKTGVKFVRIQGRVMYRPEDIREFMKGQIK